MSKIFFVFGFFISFSSNAQQWKKDSTNKQFTDSLINRIMAPLRCNRQCPSCGIRVYDPMPVGRWVRGDSLFVPYNRPTVVYY